VEFRPDLRPDPPVAPPVATRPPTASASTVVEEDLDKPSPSPVVIPHAVVTPAIVNKSPPLSSAVPVAGRVPSKGVSLPPPSTPSESNASPAPISLSNVPVLSAGRVFSVQPPPPQPDLPVDVVVSSLSHSSGRSDERKSASSQVQTTPGLRGPGDKV
jgi:hypothetical protein